MEGRGRREAYHHIISSRTKIYNNYINIGACTVVLPLIKFSPYTHVYMHNTYFFHQLLRPLHITTHSPAYSLHPHTRSSRLQNTISIAVAVFDVVVAIEVGLVVYMCRGWESGRNGYVPMYLYTWVVASVPQTWRNWSSCLFSRLFLLRLRALSHFWFYSRIFSSNISTCLT